MNDFLTAVLATLLAAIAAGAWFFTVAGAHNWLRAPEYGSNAWGKLEYTMWVVLFIIAVLATAGFLVVVL